jgi:hypothetical protein
VSRDRDWQLGPWGPVGAVQSAGAIARSAVHPTGRQRAAWRALGLLVGALALVGALMWAVGAGCSNAYDRGEGCKVSPDVQCRELTPGPGQTRPETPQTTVP